ncbi:MAG: hypothetical protein KJ002_12100, partial [Candidatus Dadabacteria bacterium]|nr:hypothetical protein [Candidatus Dadabacteria bacterium]
MVLCLVRNQIHRTQEAEMSQLISDDLPKAGDVHPLDTFESIGLRRSIRWYEPNKPVERWKIQAMLEASR